MSDATMNNTSANACDSGSAYVRAQTEASARRLLEQAAAFAEFHTKKTMFERRMGKGAGAVVVRLEWPGVLAVYDPSTGAQLARSVPGQPWTPAGFGDHRP